MQVLPAKAIGKLLSKAQATEESGDDTSSDDDYGNACNYNDYLPAPTSAPCLHQNRISYSIRLSCIIPGADMLPIIYLSEVQSPPPDACRHYI